MKIKQLLYIMVIFSTVHAGHQHIVALSIPKAGSFLLYKCIQLITDKQPKHAYHADQFADWENYFVTNHELPTQQALDGYHKQNIKAVFISRDPRDHVVSTAHFFKEKLKHPIAAAMLMPELIIDCIHNSCLWWKYVVFANQDMPKCPSVRTLYDAMMSWAQQEFVYATTFEKLVGPRGDGDRDVQIREISTIAAHIGYPITDQRAQDIADNLFGRFETFRQGQIGAWKEDFTQKHKDIFKTVTGNLLITLGYEQQDDW